MMYGNVAMVASAPLSTMNFNISFVLSQNWFLSLAALLPSKENISSFKLSFSMLDKYFL